MKRTYLDNSTHPTENIDVKIKGIQSFTLLWESRRKLKSQIFKKFHQCNLFSLMTRLIIGNAEQKLTCRKHYEPGAALRLTCIVFFIPYQFMSLEEVL